MVDSHRVGERFDLDLQRVAAVGVADHMVGGQHQATLGGDHAARAQRLLQPFLRHAAGHAEELGDRVSLILDGGPCAVGIESTIVDCSGGEPLVLRPGHISPAHLEAVFGRRLRILTAAGALRVSGSLAAHYAPQTPMRLVAGERLLDFLNAQRHKGDRCGVIAHSQPPHAGMHHVWKLLAADPVGYAHDLYAALREMDHAGVALIAVEALPETAEWAAVADRLRRAVTGSGGA